MDECGLWASDRLAAQRRTLARLRRRSCLLDDVMRKSASIGVLQGGFHGRTYGAMALTTSKTVYRQGFAPLMPQVCSLCGAAQR